MKITSKSATVVALLMLTGCGSAEPAAPAAAGAAASTTTESEKTTGRLGPASSSCDLPVAFELVASWNADPIDAAGKTGDAAGGFRNGPFEAVCSVDGKEAGTPAILRVYTSEPGLGDTRQNLQTFVTNDAGAVDGSTVRRTAFTELTIGGVPAVEVTWQRYDTAKKKSTNNIAFALDTPKKAVLVQLIPSTAGDFKTALPAYALVKTSLTVKA